MNIIQVEVSVVVFSSCVFLSLHYALPSTTTANTSSWSSRLCGAHGVVFYLVWTTCFPLGPIFGETFQCCQNIYYCIPLYPFRVGFEKKLGVLSEIKKLHSNWNFGMTQM